MIDLRQGDCLQVMSTIPAKSIDMIMTDLISLADSSSESIDFMLSIIERHHRENLSHRISLLVQEALPTAKEIRGQ